MPYEWDSLLDLSAFDQFFSEVFETNQVTAGDLLKRIVNGEEILNRDLIFKLIKCVLFQDMDSLKTMFLFVLGILLMETVVRCFCQIFEKKELEELSSYFFWMLLLGVLLENYIKTSVIATESWNQVLTFMKMLAPAYLISVGSITGVSTATCFYQLLLLLLGLIDTVLIGACIPAIHIFVMMICMDTLLGGEQFQDLEELLEKGIIWGMKIAFTMMTGIGFVKGILAPVEGSINHALLQKTLGVIPGIGNISNTITSAMTGSALLIKNTLGGFALCILILLTILPVCKIGCIALIMKITGAIGGVFGKNRLAKSTIRISDGCFLLARLTFSMNALCFLVIAMTAYTTNVSL